MALYLTRKRGESIVIADNITITVVEIEHGRVRIGLEAPKEVRIDREEVRRDRLQREKDGVS